MYRRKLYNRAQLCIGFSPIWRNWKVRPRYVTSDLGGQKFKGSTRGVEVARAGHTPERGVASV